MENDNLKDLPEITPEAVTTDAPKKATPKKKLPNWAKRTLRISAWTVGSFAALIALVLCLTVWILTPERLTPLAEKLANENLNADVKIKHMELTAWKTFPYFTVDVDGVDIRSHSLDKQKASLPEGVDSLLSVGSLRTSVNLLKLFLLKVEVGEVTIDSPKVNLVVVNDSLNNYTITKPSEEKEEEETESSNPLRSIVLKSFKMTNNRGIRYRDLKSDIDVTINTDTFTVAHSDDSYHLTLNGKAHAALKSMGIDQNIPFAFNGNATWDIKATDATLKDFKVNVADVPVCINADAALTDSTVVKSLDMNVGPVYVSKLLTHVPAQYKEGIEDFKTDLNANMKLKLTKPYTVGGKELPTFSAQLLVPDCYIANSNARIDQVTADAKIDFNGKNPDASLVTLNKVLVNGFGISLNVSGTATQLMSDPDVKAKINGSLDIAQVLNLLPEKMPFNLSGTVGLNTDVQFHVSDFSVATFHRIKANGEVTASDVRYSVPADKLQMFVDHSVFKFGTDSKITGQDNITRNMLMASVQVDSVIITNPSGRISASGLKAGVGSLGNVNNLMDTTQITPLGGQITLRHFSMLSLPDSSQVLLQGMKTNASLSRFEGQGRTPVLSLGIKADYIRYWDHLTMTSLHDGNIEAKATKRTTKASTELGIDGNQTNGNYRIDMATSTQYQKLLNNWDLSGFIRASRGRLFTPYFPLSNKLKDVDISFNTKRVDVKNVSYSVGKSDLKFSGYIDNIRSTLLGSQSNPLTVKLKAHSNVLDLNELMAAMYKGTNFANDEAKKSSFAFSGQESENQLQSQIENTADEGADTTHYAILIPTNVVLDVDLSNDKTYYTDFELNRLHSSIGVKNGVFNLRDLSAHSDDGSLKLDLVYATANRNDIGLGLAVNLDDIKVGKLLTIIEGLDTIMPMLKGVDGVINAHLAATTKIDTLMNVILPSTNAALNISGKDLVLLDTETFRSLSKWLMFKNKSRNMIDSLSVEATIIDSQLDVYPFILRMDRYKLAVSGWNDFDTNYKYHISVLDSPIPFKFGINIKGNVNNDKMKIRLGRAKLKEKTIAQTSAITETTKRNLYERMNEVFRKGAEAGLREERKRKKGVVAANGSKKMSDLDKEDDTLNLTHADSLLLIENGVIEAPDTAKATAPAPTTTKAKGKKGRKSERRSEKQTAIREKNATKEEN